MTIGNVNFVNDYLKFAIKITYGLSIRKYSYRIDIISYW